MTDELAVKHAGPHDEASRGPETTAGSPENQALVRRQRAIPQSARIPSAFGTICH
jgi:hypothetical protein